MALVCFFFLFGGGDGGAMILPPQVKDSPATLYDTGLSPCVGELVGITNPSCTQIDSHLILHNPRNNTHDSDFHLLGLMALGSWWKELKSHGGEGKIDNLPL